MPGLRHRVHERGVVGSTFVIVDVETTGLEQGNHLLELGMVVMRFLDIPGKDAGLSPATPGVYGWSLDAIHHRTFYRYRESDQPLWESHRTNGLAEECAESSHTVGNKADEELARLLPEKCIPVGRNVHFDMEVLKRELPLLAARFHYRHLDLTTLEMADRNQGAVIYPARGATTHRALHDCLLEYQSLLQLGFTPVVQHRWTSLDPSKPAT